VAVQRGPDDAQDGAGEQDRQGHVGADEGGGEDGGHDGEGRRGSMGQGGEEADEGPVRAAGARAARQSVQTRARAYASVRRHLPRLVCPSNDTARLCRVPRPFFAVGHTCPAALPALRMPPSCVGCALKRESIRDGLRRVRAERREWRG